MIVSGPWLTAPGLRRVLGLLAEAGHQALVVGGAVRNDLLGVPISDVDIATDARPDRVTALLAGAGLRAIPTGLEHGTITALSDGQAFEITTFRRDVETDGRRAVVAFADRVEDDAQRRDFTINALYATAEGEVLDPTGGLADLPARRLRFVGDPATRIAEDYLRILRLYRFWAQYGAPDRATHAAALAAIRPHVAGLAQISRERIGAEMRKLLAVPDPVPMVADMAAAGVLAQALPGAEAAALPALIAAEGRTPPAALRRIAVLGGTDPVAALRLSRDEARALAAIARAKGLPAHEAAYRHGAEAARDAALIAAAHGAPLPKGLGDAIARGAAATFPICAADLPGLTGKPLGDALKALESRWITSGFTATRADLLGG